MKNRKISIKTVTLIVLIGMVVNMFFIILNIKNNNIAGQEITKEQLGETTTDNAYVSIATHMSALDEKQKEITNMQNTAGKATATAGQILKNYTAYKNGQLITGTMANNGAVTKALKAGGSYTIPAGYHNGSGKVTANSLASQTQATATASDIASGKTAWVNGKLVTGTSKIDYKQIFAIETLSKKNWDDTATYTSACGTLTGSLNGATFKATIDCTIKAYFSMSYSGAFQNSYITVSSGCEVIEKKVDTNNKREYIIKVPQGKTVTIFAGAHEYTSYSMGVICSKIF